MEMLDYLKYVRRSLHKIPELFHQEFLTQKFIVTELDKLKIKYKKIKTAVIAEIEGIDSKTLLAFRADMDALPITEQNDTDYKSEHIGKMHACGHDGHMAVLLGVAKYFSETKPSVNLRLIFQPAEECEGGAEMLIENGVLKGVNAIFGLHLSPEYPVGVIATDAGAIFAGACDFHIIFEGTSGHCADYQKHIDAIKNVKSKSVHGPFADLCLGSSDKMIREVTRNRFEYAYDVAKKLKAQNLVLHHGYVPKTSYPPNWIKRSFTFFDDFFANKSNDIKIHLENVLEFDSDMLFEVIEGLQGKNIDVCLDIGHAHCNSKISVVEWIKRLKGKIGYVHMHDNNGFEDEHLGLGMGNIPLDEVCEVLEQYSPQAIWAIESKTDHIQKSIDWMMTRGYIK